MASATYLSNPVVTIGGTDLDRHVQRRNAKPFG
jgi:hypothetical protein